MTTTEQVSRQLAPARGAPDPLLLLVGSGDRGYREYIIEAAAAHYRLWLLDAAAPTWQQPYLAGAATINTRDPQAIVAAAREVRQRYGRISGLLCYDEWLVHSTATAAQVLGLPTSSPAAVAACRDKAATRRLLTAAGVPQPRSIAVGTAAEAIRAAQTIGYPVVVKARSLGGSFGVVRADCRNDMPAAYAAADGIIVPGVLRPTPPVLIEEYLDGPEISIDCAVTSGHHHALVLARKQTGLHPYFEETGHVVDASDPLLADPGLSGAIDSIHRALCFDNGVTHVEFRLTAGGPRLVEINARLGGDFIPYLGWLASGIDSARAAADLAVGCLPDARPTRHRVAGIRFLYPPSDCRVREVVIRHERMTSAVHRVRVTAGPGRVLRLPPRGYMSRYGYIIAVADTADELSQVLDAPENLVELHADPV